MAQDTTTRQFLDYTGLSTFWTNIVNKFATKTDALKHGSLTIVDSATPAVTRGISYQNVAGTSTEVLTLPAATREKAGLMSADQFAIVDDLQANIDSMAPFAGLKIDGDEISLTGRKGNIKLEYSATGSGANREAFIALIDADYPDGNWTKITKEAYEAGIAQVGVPEGKYVAYNDTDPDTEDAGMVYYVWSENAAGPVSALGRPLLKKPISKINVTELVKSGFLSSSDVVVDPAGYTPGTYLKLVFATGELGEGTDTVFINVTDLVEIYEAGEGITITHKNEGIDDTKTTGTIKVNAANDTTLGAVKTGYDNTGKGKTYAVKLDASNNAYVAVPWDDVQVTISSDGVTTENKKYLEITSSPTSENGTDTFAFKIEVGDGIKAAETYARSAVQVVNGDNTYTSASVTNSSDYAKAVQVKLTTAAEASLGLADSAVQTITKATDYVTVEVSNPDKKGEKSYAIDLSTSTKTSLGKADSAVQEITILGTKLTKDSNTYTIEQAKKALTLGTASNSNITTDVTLATTNHTSAVDGPGATAVTNPTVPTTAAVKTYIDNAISTSESKDANALKNAIEALDSNVSLGTVGNAFDDTTVAQMVYNKIEIADGKLVATDGYALKIKDITDFRPLTAAEINEICGVNA